MLSSVNLGEVTAFAFGGASETLSAVHKPAYPDHFEQIEFAARCDIFHVFGHKFCSETVFCQRKDLERVCHRRLAHLHYVSDFDGA